MTTMIQNFTLAAAFCLAATGSFAHENDQPNNQAGPADVAAAAQFAPTDYKVFVDEPTGYAFIKTSSGWKFIKQLDEARIQDALAIERAGTPLLTVAHLPSVDVDSASPTMASLSLR